MTTLLAGSIVLWAASIITTLFVVLYGFFSPWWREEMGRHIFSSMLATALVLDLSILRLFIADSKAFAFIRLFVFIYYTATMAWRLWILIRVQIFKREDEDRDEDSISVDSTS